ncbi:hypothetical protein FHS18_001390 [Paenibacillus phyllosphaerae]|uniref:Mannosyl-glycoprotein endo-beta-N-acetylglucosamidase-like domain-containing protein n=1 Tax=Paenibacillus phyllosphaerae TaxID=274593 RepID=A0A7W5AV51_9BACL|nr:glucosaminidase domain-containing protein [Paenibacillus phyllosphaerae]MBB3109338.1 hypothetical protein [Paenibacillus phyllosphaerae]
MAVFYSTQQFIAMLAPIAALNAAATGVPASLTIAQGILESSSGNSGLAASANNLFGIKGSGPAGSVLMPTREQRADGTVYTVNARFRAYNSWSESVADHSQLLARGVSWNRSIYHGALRTDGRSAARALQAAGYATDINYANKLIALIDRYQLVQYDQAKGEEPMTAEEKAAFDELAATVRQQAQLIASLTVSKNTLKDWLTSVDGRLKQVEGQAQLPAPSWFVDEFGTDDLDGLITNKSGSLDFWRTLAIVLRMRNAGLL